MNKAIGIFDSGIGGLTVFKALKKILPNEQLIYFGDTARIPYGTKSKKLVQQYAVEITAFLLNKNVKMIVIACNTASAMAIDLLEQCLDIPIVGVVIPGAAGSVRETNKNRIGVIGTTATINSNAYAKVIKEQNPEIEVFSAACPLLVPIVEEGMLSGEITNLILKSYLEDIIRHEVDTLILGCTHYPLLHNSIRSVVGEGIKLIDSGRETAQAVQKVLLQSKITNSGEKNDDQFYVSDIPQKFEEIGTRFLEEPLISVNRIDFEKFIEDNHDSINTLKVKTSFETVE